MTAAFALALLLQFPAPPQPAFDERVACAPMNGAAAQTASVKILGGRVPGRLMFGPGEQVVVSGAAAQGLQVGQLYFIRRSVTDRFTPSSPDFVPNSVHTTGWLRIVDVQGTMSVATIDHACDAVFEGDYLEPFTAPTASAPPASAIARPDFTNPGRIVMADERRQMGYPGLLMLVNRGSDQGVQPGQGLTIFRPTLNGNGPVQTIGAATVVSVYPQLSIVRIDSIKDAVFVGDLAAIHRITP
jgi:hypothetical protein